MNLHSKLPNVGTTIFSIMSQLAAKHGAINLSQGLPNFEVDQQLKDLINHYVQGGNNLNAPMAGLMHLRPRPYWPNDARIATFRTPTLMPKKKP
ncbi:hypothetical protein [Neolewinella persica]|uniref:hypothetical protein n=1 Tax=Neolewinella persica TaxID=70998 RepID=UPI0003A77D67|nr:hypothetical protein [Neolewinella persica]